MLSRLSEQVGEGVVFADKDGWFPVRAADGAMYDAKRSGSGGVRYPPTQPVLARTIEPLD